MRETDYISRAIRSINKTGSYASDNRCWRTHRKQKGSRSHIRFIFMSAYFLRDALNMARRRVLSQFMPSLIATAAKLRKPPRAGNHFRALHSMNAKQDCDSDCRRSENENMTTRARFVVSRKTTNDSQNLKYFLRSLLIILYSASCVPFNDRGEGGLL